MCAPLSLIFWGGGKLDEVSDARQMGHPPKSIVRPGAKSRGLLLLALPLGLWGDHDHGPLRLYRRQTCVGKGRAGCGALTGVRCGQLEDAFDAHGHSQSVYEQKDPLMKFMSWDPRLHARRCAKPNCAVFKSHVQLQTRSALLRRPGMLRRPSAQV